ncbi:MAG: SHOCT domain-containing protein [Phycisphaeraceae bacterium]|nr:SHOCT domain-containing protein [Phycisphaeraceae bacterium]
MRLLPVTGVLRLPITVGATAAGSPPIGRILAILAAAVAGIVLGGLLILFIRRRVTGAGAGDRAGIRAPGLSSGFTLDDIRTMHEAGEISDAEFETMRSRIIDRARR